ASPPAGNNFLAIGAGTYFSLGLRNDGTIVGWGRNDFGQTTTPAGNNFVSIAAGGYHGLALKQDGSVVGWGRNDYGECNSPGGNDFVAIAAGGYHSLALRQDGSVVGWGRNDYGQATPPAGKNFVVIAAGEFHSPAIFTSCGYSIIGDVNDDCRVDSKDLQIFSEQWLAPNGIADLDKVNGVNLIDFALLAQNWLIDCKTEPGNPACVLK
ncbi:MAG: hypothetical protein MUO27_07410, partial [Sedimentisphaerales bacterium]|nr:hypothetical protein [Sedimentisphaerales bacterium]